MAILPHRFPFLMIDKVIEFIPRKRVVAIKNVSINEPYFTGHFPTKPVMPGVLQIESLTQASGLLLYEECENCKLAYLVAVDKVKFRRQVVPGDQLRIETELIKQRNTIGVARAVGYINNDVVVEAEIKFILEDK